MRWEMVNDNRRAMLGLLALVLLVTAKACGDEVTWIPGASSPLGWSIQPTDPNDGDMIYFSGPTRVYVSPCVAERELGGKPMLQVNVNKREIKLAFQPPAGEDCATMSPVCGLEGSFGQLAAGQWVFVCRQSGINVSIPFTVTTNTSRIVYYVDSRATGSRKGTSWTEAFTDLQSALAAADDICEIRVARGVYRPDGWSDLYPGDQTSTFELKTGVTLKGGFAGVGSPNPNQRDILVHETVLSGDLLANDDASIIRGRLVGHASRADNCHHVVTAIDTGSSAVLDGFTIRGGHAFGSGSPDDFSCGGALFIDSASPVIRNCLIEGNAAGYYGGGIYCRGNGAPMFIECVLADNWSYWRGGGMYKDWGSRVHMERCLISGNSTIYDGGGIAHHTEGELTLSNCIFSGNMCTGVDSGRGGAIYCCFATVSLNHCTLTGNFATHGASLACASSNEPGSSHVEISNCILWDRGDSVWIGDSSAVEAVYSDVQGGWNGRGNLDVAPQFVNAGRWDDKSTPNEPADDAWFDGDYRLAWSSSCIDAGDPNESLAANARDFGGRSRRSGVAVDMGAYETRNEPPIADAGPNVAGFSLDGVSGSIALDAGRSLDPEGQTLTYRWYRDGQLVSSQAKFTTVLPVGQYTFTLIVNDGIRDSDPDEVVAGIWPIIPTLAAVSPGTINRTRPGQAVIAMIMLPPGKRVTDFDLTQPMLLFPGGIEATTQTTMVWMNGAVYAIGRFDLARLLAAVTTNGDVELRVVGALKDNRYFSGADTIKIK
jgi:hypothetical protein